MKENFSVQKNISSVHERNKKRSEYEIFYPTCKSGFKQIESFSNRTLFKYDKKTKAALPENKIDLLTLKLC